MRPHEEERRPTLLSGPTGWATPLNDDGRARRVEVNADGRHRQHFLLRSEAVTLTEAQVARMSDAEAYAVFEQIRFAATDGVPCCPFEGCETPNAYRMTIRRKLMEGVQEQPKYKCRACRKPFTITSGKTFARRKMSIRDILLAHIVFVNAVSGEAALRLRRAIGCSYKASFVLEGKVREAIGLSREARSLEGAVEVDGTTIGGHQRKAPEKKGGKDSRVGPLSPESTIIAIRERSPTGRTRVGIFKNEAAYRDVTTGRDFIRDNVKRNSIMISDEGFQLGYIGPTRRVNHRKGYRNAETFNHTNGVESFFARVKRAENGVHYRMAGKNVDLYAEEMAWREDNRRKSNGEQFKKLLAASAAAPTSKRWSGYWQRWEADDATIRRRRREPLTRARPVPV